MGITIVNKNYSTRNYPAGNGFELSNAAQIVTDTVDIVVDYTFESSMQQLILFVSATSIQILNGNWATLGISVGDVLELTGSILNGGNTVIYNSASFTVIDIQGDLLTVDSTLEDPPPNPPSQTTSVVGQLMPAAGGSTSNTSLLIVNTSVTAPESIEIFHNLVQNSSSGSDSSLFDGEVNRFRAIGTDTMFVGNTITMDQLGDQSGGTYISVILERLANVGALFSYQIVFIYANPYKFESDDFDEPTQYAGQNSLKPYYRFRGFPVANDPNSYLELVYSVQQGNLGWYDESYNQGQNLFVVSSVSFETVTAVPLTAPDPYQVTVVEVVITGNVTFLEKVEAEFYLIPPIDTVKNQPTNNGNNISLSNFFFDETGPTVIETTVLGNNNATIPTNQHSIVLGVNEITIGFRLNPTAGFETLINSLNPNQWQYRIAINVEDNEGTPNKNNAVSLIVSEGLMIDAPKIGGDFDGLRNQTFYDHNNDIGETGVLPYLGNPEDDVLYFATVDFNKADTWVSATLDVRITRDSDSEFFILQEQFIPFSPYITTPNGVQQINFLQTIQQFLDGPNRNKVQMQVNGTDTPTTYEVDITYSLLINWREWLSQSNAFVDFFDNTLPQNGLNKEWMNYLRLAGYTLSVEVTLIDDANTAFRFGGEMQLVDYDDTPDVTTTVLYYDENDVATSFFIAGQTNKIEATHVNNSGTWDQDITWGWNSIRPFEGEENKRISTKWTATTQDIPLKPLTGQTVAEITFPALDKAVVTCAVDTNEITSDVSSVIVKINDPTNNVRNVHIEQINKVKLPSVVDTEDRGLKFCKTPIRAIATLDSADLDKNSRLGLAYKLDNITVMLERQSDGAEIVAPGIAVNFPHQPDAVGWIIDWRQLTRMGPAGIELAQDCYRVRIDWTVGTTTNSFYECSIELLQYNNMNTEGYCNIFVVLNDLVKHHGINYKDSGFASTLMFEGQFGFMQPNFLTTNNIYQGDSSRRKIDIKAIRTYELRTNQLLSCITQQLDADYLLAANQIYITDWNANNHIQNLYTSFAVILSKDDSPSFEYGQGVYATMKVVFKDKQQLHESKYSGDIKGSDNIILELPTIIGTSVISGSGDLIPKTNASISFQTDDDGDLKEGRDDDFFTLPSARPNPYGTFIKLTDEFGTQVYASGIVVDWSTFNGVQVTGYTKNYTGVIANWGLCVSGAAALSLGTFTSGWRLTNIRELTNLFDYSQVMSVLNYHPFFILNNVNLTTSTSFPSNPINIYISQINNGSMIPQLKTAGTWFLGCRTFTVTGTVLT